MFNGGVEYDRGTAFFFVGLDGQMKPEVMLNSLPTCADTRTAYIDDVITDDLALVPGVSCSEGRPALLARRVKNALTRLRGTSNRHIKKMSRELDACSVIDDGDAWLVCAERSKYRHYTRFTRRLLVAVRRARAMVSWSFCWEGLDDYAYQVVQHRDDLETLLLSISDGDAAGARSATRQLRNDSRRARNAWGSISGNC